MDPAATSPQRVTQLLAHWTQGDDAALGELTPLVYEELRRLAHYHMGGERPDHTLQTTALVNEAYLRLADQTNPRWQDRAHFFAVASQTMRHILVDYARAQAREKRGGGAQKLSLDEAVSFSKEKEVDLLVLDESLRELAAIDEQQSKIVELRFFGGLTVEETAVVLHISPATVKREWRIAKAWLFKRMRAEG